MRTERVYHASGLRQVHRQRVVRYAGFEAKVDEPLAPLVLALWRAGVYTLSSCQNYDGVAWIVFTSEPAAAFFKKVCCPRGLEVRAHGIPEMWSLGTVYSAFFPPREISAATRRLKQHLAKRR